MLKKMKNAAVKFRNEIKKAIRKPGIQSALCMCAAFAFFLAELAEMFCMFPTYYNACEYPQRMRELED